MRNDNNDFYKYDFMPNDNQGSFGDDLGFGFADYHGFSSPDYGTYNENQDNGYGFGYTDYTGNDYSNVGFSNSVYTGTQDFDNYGIQNTQDIYMPQDAYQNTSYNPGFGDNGLSNYTDDYLDSYSSDSYGDIVPLGGNSYYSTRYDYYNGGFNGNESDSYMSVSTNSFTDFQNEDALNIPELDDIVGNDTEKKDKKKKRKLFSSIKFKGKLGKTSRIIGISAGSALAAAAAVVLIWVGLVNSNIGYVKAKEVCFDGYVVGAVKDEAALEAEMTRIYDELSEEYGTEVISCQDLVMNDALVAPKYISDPSEIGAEIKKNIDVQIHATVIYVDGMAAVALNNEDEANWVLDKLAEPYLGSSVEDPEFVEDVEIKTENVSYALLKDREDAYEVIAVGSGEKETYVVQEGDTLASIASANGIRTSDILTANSSVNSGDDIVPGMEITVASTQSLINVGHVEIITVVSDINYTTEYTSDSSMYVGNSKTVQAGVKGEKTSTVEVHYIGGVEVSRTVISEEVTKQPKNAIVARGTKKIPTVVGGVSAAGYAWPTTGSITSPFGPRWGSFHYGIDIANAYGTVIRAAKSGTVTTAGYSGAYGYLVEINHGDGSSTRYGHNSSLLVSVGQTVTQGEAIALMGSTGRSTGVHCHFEVRINGTAYNPMNFL